MLELLWLIPALPFAGFLILALFGARLARTVTALIGVGSVGVTGGASTAQRTVDEVIASLEALT